ncbi:DNA mismatch repair protein MutS [Clostridium sp. 'deep sea']|uniref:DNA mismatch repair protein MutS n=1 Tax=Clostridium sp. 'deep sea' TaxID=2779445 RepID=UPI0018969B4D|nr:DNA mismatch repair protein MutS [Clostridium sp. 'deep sea']QOR35775.1 DNA mismatch repair protein MutS [Clostridium sp. 'deep sea']
MTQYTPMLRQYLEIKSRYKDCILFFRLGDFYEMFFDDAKYASDALNIVLTARDGGKGKKIPMCGVPYHSANNYIQKLISCGKRVAICEQVEDAKQAKGLVKRDVVNIITPGTLADGDYLDPDQNNFLMSIFHDYEGYGFSIVDVSTGYFRCGQFTDGNLLELLSDEFLKFSPAELVTNFELNRIKQIDVVVNTNNIPINYVSESNKNLINSIISRISFVNCDHLNLGKEASYLLLQYINKTQKSLLTRITNIEPVVSSEYMKIDNITKRNLELTETMRDNKKRGSLFWLLDNAVTPMGSRYVRELILNPLMNVDRINKRLEVVEELTNDTPLFTNIRDILKNILDIERIVGKLALGNANGKDVRSLIISLQQAEQLYPLRKSCRSSLLSELLSSLNELSDLTKYLDKAIMQDPPTSVKDGGIIETGYNDEIDRLKDIKDNGQQWIAKLEANERQQTGIKSLKIGFNKVFGYYLEITKSNLHLTPEHYIRKQTLSNAERYITPELKQKEEDILTAEEKLNKLEFEVFSNIIKEILQHVYALQRIAQSIATIDSLSSFAQVAIKYDFVRPCVNYENNIKIVNGRHPVIEQVVEIGSFIPNTVSIADNDIFHIITGPNMSGKSTYMRQVALIILMAQIGSFVPASQATIGIVDRLFTRVGASDDIFSGHSTFMVEMKEVANICKNATKKSFVILDEIGRGTSTYDGMSIARAVSEFLVTVGCRVLFATHYHELVDLADLYQEINNYSVAVHEDGQDIVFLHKIIPGPSNRSYGIHVCRLAGIPKEVISSASKYLELLESGKNEVAATSEVQMSIPLRFESQKNSKVEDEIMAINAEHLTPFNALTYIVKWQSEIIREKNNDKN